jgi:plasmid stabilization system protein ParE
VSEVVWLPEALEDMGRLRLFLEDKSPSAAARMAKTVLDGVTLLRDFSERGKPLNDGTSRRELYIAFGSGAYVLRYRIDGELVVIIRVWHSREDRSAIDRSQ